MTTAAPAWTVYLCRSTPGVRKTASVIVARGAAITWCGPGCCPETDDEQHQEAEDMTGKHARRGIRPGGIPAPGEAAETRGGEHPDWANARPGEPLPQLPEENNDPDAP